MNDDDLDEADDLDDLDDAPYDPSQPISIFNHPPFSQMSIREIQELEESWP